MYALPSALLATLGLLALPALGATDPCATLSTLQAPTPAQVSACYSSFPFDATRRDQTVRTLLALAEQSANTDYALHPPVPSFTAPINHTAILNSFLGKSFPSDYAFQKALQLAVYQFNDAHMRYSPRCYGTHIARLPFYLAVVTPALSTPKVYIAGVTASSAAQYGSWNGAEVVKIGGIPALTYLQNYADTESAGFKEPLSRLAQVLVSPIWNSDEAKFSVRAGAFTARTIIPTSDTLTFSLRKASSILGSTDVRVPYTVQPAPVAYTDGASYWNTYCAPFSVSDNAQSRPDPGIVIPGGIEIDPLESVNEAASVSVSFWKPKFPGFHGGRSAAIDVDGQPITDATNEDLTVADPTDISNTIANATVSSNTTASSSPGVMMFSAASISMPTITTQSQVRPPVLLANGPGFGIFTQTLQDDKTIVGILALTSMEDAGFDLLTNLAQGLQALKAAKATRLIIDVSNNLGGSSCTARCFAGLFRTPASKSYPDVDRPWSARFRSTPTGRQWASLSEEEGAPSDYNPMMWLDANQKPIGPNSTTFVPGVNLGAGHQFNYSMPTIDNCDGSSIPPEVSGPFNAGIGNWASADMVVLSNGICVSACALFVTYLQDVLGVKVIAAGGSGALGDRGVASSHGGLIFNYQKFTEMIDGLGITDDPSSFQNLPERANFASTVRLAYSYKNPAIPMEFAGQKGDLRQDYTVNQILGVGDRWAQAYSAAWGAPPSSGIWYPWAPCHHVDGRH